MNGINYGGLIFTNPVPHAFALPPCDPGLFVVQVRNLSFSPLPYQPIAFGEAGNLAALSIEIHADFPLWKAHRLADSGLFLSFCALRYESASYREVTRADLAVQYVDRSETARRPDGRGFGAQASGGRSWSGK